jgi:hypothetical protein
MSRPRSPQSLESKIAKQIDFSFEWVLPGHGERFHAESHAAMRRELERCVAFMKKV